MKSVYNLVSVRKEFMTTVHISTDEKTSEDILKIRIRFREE